MTLAIAIAIVAGPAGIGALLYLSSTPWPATLKDFQSLAGGMFALSTAGLALLGVLLTLNSQRRNLDRQLAAQRQSQDEEARRYQRRCASAFIGEIRCIVDQLRHRAVRLPLERNLDALKSSKQANVPVTTVSVSGNLATYYRHSPGDVGQFDAPLPEDLTRFYDDFAGIVSALNHFYDYITFGKGNMREEQVVDLHNDVIGMIDRCLVSGPALIAKLDAFRKAGE